MMVFRLLNALLNVVIAYRDHAGRQTRGEADAVTNDVQGAGESQTSEAQRTPSTRNTIGRRIRRKLDTD